MGIQCPKCGSEHVQKVSVIVQSGTSFNNGVVTGVGIGDGVGAGFGTTSGISKTNLAAKFSMPEKPRWGLTLWFSLGVIWLTFGTPPITPFRYAAIAAWIILGYFVRKDFKEMKQHREYYKKWEPLYQHGFFCHRCGNSYIPQ